MEMNEPIRSQFDPEKAKVMLIAAEAWTARRKAEVAQQAPDWRAALAEASKNLPEAAQIPYERTPEGERWTRFKAVMKDNASEFLKTVDRSQLRNPAAFDLVAGWDGKFPGPIATGPTGYSKSRAAFSAIGRLFVKENRPFTWFPVLRLISEFTRYEKKDLTDEFYRHLTHYPVLLVDDVDKINWAFESQPGVLFQFYDWVYRAKRPCITTTNKDRAWWVDHMGEPFVRRLFDEAHFTVNF